LVIDDDSSDEDIDPSAKLDQGVRPQPLVDVQLIILPDDVNDLDAFARSLDPCADDTRVYDDAMTHESPSDAMAHVAGAPGAPSPSSIRLLDSGASDHMANDLIWFAAASLRPHQVSISVVDVNGGLVSAGIGRIHTISGTVDGIMHVPGLMHHLLSVPALARKGHKVEFRTGRGIVTDNRGNVVFEAMLVGGQYIVPFKLLSSAHAATVAPLDPRLWHARLGHLSHQEVRRNAQSDAVPGIKLAGRADDDEVCPPCGGQPAPQEARCSAPGAPYRITRW
jgi:hypothetical protein